MGILTKRLGKVLCQPDSLYEDQEFRPGDQALGLPISETAQALSQRIEWRRFGDICSQQSTPARLFRGAPDPGVIRQGTLGDCWLLCALASLTQRPGVLQRCFKEISVSSKGCYTVRLYSAQSRAWKSVLIDDWLPCDRTYGKLLYARAVDGAGWVPLLEKAMAKHLGSYAAMHGGNTAWALQALSGWPCHKFRFHEPTARWQQHKLVYGSDSTAQPMELTKTERCIDSASMFHLLLRKHCAGALVAASSGKSMQAQFQPEHGIRPDHAYTVYSVYEGHGVRLVKLWVPGGGRAWKGDWSNDSSKWGAHPDVQQQLRGHEADGMFWMSWADFSAFFYSLEFCSEPK